MSFDGGTLKYLTGFVDSARPVTLANNGTFDTNGFNSELAGKITGSGALMVTGGGRLTLSNNTNDYSGGTTVQEVNQVLKQYADMRRMMKQYGSYAKTKMRGLGKFAGMKPPPGLAGEK